MLRVCTPSQQWMADARRARNQGWGLVPWDIWQYGKYMARSQKMTFTLDDITAQRIDRTAARLGMPKSGVVREAIAEYAARVGQLGESERRRMLEVFDAVVPRIPAKTAKAVDREIGEVRKARHAGGRRSPAKS